MENADAESRASKREVRPYNEGVFESIRSNPWMPATIVLIIALVVVLLFGGIGGMTGNSVSGDDAGNNLIEFVNSQGQGDATLVSSVKEGTLYKVTVNYQSQDIPVYVTLDGKYLINSPIPLTGAVAAGAGSTGGQQAAAEVPKSDKPEVELFVFSYCPYGLQMEKAMIPVYESLKSKADIDIVAIGAMHGEYEKTETLRQICIQENYGNDKLWAYLKQFDSDSAIGACRGDDACLTPLIQKIYTNLGIDKAKVDACMKSDAPAIYSQQQQRATSLGISGSPTLVVNGVKVQASRSPSGIAEVVCDAFTTAPSECSGSFSTTQAGAGFGYVDSSAPYNPGNHGADETGCGV